MFITVAQLVVHAETDSKMLSMTEYPLPAQAYGKTPVTITVSQHASTRK